MDAIIVEYKTNLEAKENTEIHDHNDCEQDAQTNFTNKTIFEVYVKNNLNPESILIQIQSDASIENNAMHHSSYNIKDKSETSLQNNTTFELTGYVRIAANEDYSIPVYIHNKHHIYYITVHVEDSITNELICICNSLQINRRFIEIKRDKNKQSIIVPSHKMNDNSELSDLDLLFVSWSLPNNLVNAMKNQGWYDINLWNEITKQDLINMGFQRGHQMKFFHQFRQITTNNNLNTIFEILNSWYMPISLISTMIENGWNNPEEWETISDEQFKQMDFGDGHIIKFKKQIRLKRYAISN